MGNMIETTNQRSFFFNLLHGCFPSISPIKGPSLDCFASRCQGAVQTSGPVDQFFVQTIRGLGEVHRVPRLGPVPPLETKHG
jgi:hypothetical protein